VLQWQELYLDKNYMNKGAAAKGLGSQKVPEFVFAQDSPAGKFW